MNWHYTAPPSPMRVIAHPTQPRGRVVRYADRSGFTWTRYVTPDDFWRQTSRPSLLDRLHTALTAGVIIGMVALCLVVLLRGLS